MARHYGAAVRNFKRFHGRNPKRLSHFNFTVPRTVTFLGTLHAIEYESTKKLYGTHRQRLYRHKSGPGVKIYLHPNGRSLIITGGHFRVTDWMRG